MTCRILVIDENCERRFQIATMLNQGDAIVNAPEIISKEKFEAIKYDMIYIHDDDEPYGLIVNDEWNKQGAWLVSYSNGYRQNANFPKDRESYVLTDELIETCMNGDRFMQFD